VIQLHRCPVGKRFGRPLCAHQMRLRYCSRCPHEPKGIFSFHSEG